MSRGPSWFSALFGFDEPRDGDGSGDGAAIRACQARFVFDEAARTLTAVGGSGEAFACGAFRTPTLAQLRDEGQSALAAAAAADDDDDDVDAAGAGAASGVSLSHAATADVLAEHACHPGAVFQAASQFNCLEFPAPGCVPEMGITPYSSDGTQGPACALACAAGTVVRTYFARVAAHASPARAALMGEAQRSGAAGQTAAAQIDNLDLLAEALLGPPEGAAGAAPRAERAFFVQNGYSATLAPERLAKLDAVLAALAAAAAAGDAAARARRAQLLGLVKVGLHENVGVTFASRWKRPGAAEGGGAAAAAEAPTVTQVYCSALAIGYSEHGSRGWTHLARLVLDASYEATLWAGVLNNAAARLRGGGGGGGGVGDEPVFLTRIGGGVFSNEASWIDAAIARALAVVGGEAGGARLRVVCHHFRAVSAAGVAALDEQRARAAKERAGDRDRDAAREGGSRFW